MDGVDIIGHGAARAPIGAHVPIGARGPLSVSIGAARWSLDHRGTRMVITPRRRSSSNDNRRWLSNRSSSRIITGIIVRIRRAITRM
jgi:hypothetical protein